MKNTLLLLLDMPADTYENQLFENYFLWCNLNSYNDTECQKLLANAPLFRWWHIQYAELEQQFIEDSAEYHGKFDKHVMRSFYTEIVIKIGWFYCKALINSALNHKPITPQFN